MKINIDRAAKAAFMVHRAPRSVVHDQGMKRNSVKDWDELDDRSKQDWRDIAEAAISTVLEKKVKPNEAKE